MTRLIVLALLCLLPISAERLADPGKGKTGEAKVTARKNAWKRPAKQTDRDKLRDSRIQDAGYTRRMASIPRALTLVQYPPYVVLVFRDQAIADAVLREIAATPAIEDGIGPVWVWYQPDVEVNTISYAASEDGRVAIAHPWSAVDQAWLKAYCAAWVMSGDLSIATALPSDWEWPQRQMGE
jgi:hypothetical protein